MRKPWAHTFHDFDAFADTVRDADMEMMLYRLRRRYWNLNFVDVGGIHVQAGDLGSGNFVRGTGPLDRYLIYLPLSGDGESTWNGEVLRREAFATLPPGCDFSLSERDAHRWVFLSFPAGLLFGSDDAADSKGGPVGESCVVIPAQPALARRIADTIFEICDAAASCAKFQASPAAESASESLLHLSLPIFGQPSAIEAAPNGRPRLPRQEIIDRAMTLVESSGEHSVSVGKTVAVAGVSERTLRNVFNQFFGIGPARYLKHRKLRQIHRELVAAAPEAVTVTDVLVQNGVWQWGRFAARYHQEFGELPSQTIKPRGGRRLVPTR